MRKGGNTMIDILMVGLLVIGFIVVNLLTNWCQKQIDAEE